MSSRTELFLDNEMIEMCPGLSRSLHPAEKHLLNPIIRPELWWEGNQMWPYATMYDEEDKLFKMWARSGSDSKQRHIGGHAAYTTYLTSTDGVHWDKPELGALDFAGRRDHNVVLVGGETQFQQPQGRKGYITSVVKHPSPRDENDKFVGLTTILPDHGFRVCTSPDGIHWSYEDAPFWQTPIDFSSWGDDAIMQLLYDKAKRKWVVYRRVIPEESEHLQGVESDGKWDQVDRYYRVYAYTESDDLKEWKNFRMLLSMDADDPSDTELYNFSCHNYGPIYVGYMSVFHLKHPQPIDIQFATSRDGIDWTRVCRGESFIPCGQLGYYDFMAMAGSQAEPIIVDDTVYIYYEAVNFPHDCSENPDEGHRTAVALATIKRDRFACLETGDPETCEKYPSRLVTKPFTVEQPKLYVNAATWRQGSIRVEALTRDWKPIPGFTDLETSDIRGDALDHPVRWKENADLSRLIGQEIRLKFRMTRARIYAMTLSDEDRKLSPVQGRESYRNAVEDKVPTIL